MSITLTRWREGALAPLEWVGAFPMLAHDIRIEQYIDDSRYVVRAELAGYDPENEIEIRVIDGVLRIRVDRSAAKHESSHPYRAHSEFRYGPCVRSIVLPSTVVSDTAHATYRGGVLEIAFKVAQPTPVGRHIPIAADRPNDANAERIAPRSHKTAGKLPERKPTASIHNGPTQAAPARTTKEHLLARA